MLRSGGRGAVAVSTASTIVVLAALAALFWLAPGSAAVRHTFFNPADMWKSLIGDPRAGYYSVGEALWLNIRMFLAAEVLILIVALVIAVIRQSDGPVMFPLRIVSTIYVDVFRGVPLILVIFAIGFGAPALNLPFVSTQSAAVYGVAALVLSYSAYVSEVYRAGLNSVHQSQVAAARSLGLSQAVRAALRDLAAGGAQHHPAAAERLHQPAEGHRAGRHPGRDRGQQGGRDLQRHRVQLLQLRGGGHLVPPPHDPAGPVHRPPDRPGPAPPPGRGGHVTAGPPEDADAPPAVKIEGLRKSFGTNLVLDGIDLSVASHEVICLIGASGSGKSTLLRCINLLEPIDAGRILLWGQDITRPGVDQNRVRRNVGIVFQSFNLFPHMTVLRNITLAPVKALGASRREAEQEARTLLERFGLLDKQADYPDRLSGGQQQRVAIVRALAMRPRLMLLDEVTSALDPELVSEVLDVIRELAGSGMTMLIATHEMSFARDIANRVCFLAGGRIVEQGPPAELFTSPRDERTQRFLRRITDAGRL